MNDQAPFGIDQVVALLDELPRTLVPAYVTEQPNSSIPLYTGDIAVSFGDVSYVCQGSVGLEWHPSPRIRFDAVLPASEGFASLSAKPSTLCITLSGINATAEGIVTRHSYGQQAILTGTLHGQGIASGDGSRLHRLLFHLVNFPNYIGLPTGMMVKEEEGFQYKVCNSRLSAVSDGWRVTVDGFQENAQTDALKAGGGYAITHVGSIEREGGGEFTTDQAEALLEALYCLFPFLAGTWSSPLLLVGFGTDGQRVWERWAMPKVSTWRTTTSWLPTMRAQVLQEIMPGFLRLWHQPVWHQALNVAINWYLQGNTPDTVDTGLVLTQVGLELLAWVDAVEDRHQFTRTAFRRVEASEKMRVLLGRAQIGVSIPLQQQELLEFAAGAGLEDGPHAFTELRNAAVHANKLANLLNAPGGARVEAWQLGLWYMELLLLFLCGYQGSYFNRLSPDRYQTKEEPVPWNLPVRPSD